MKSVRVLLNAYACFLLQGCGNDFLSSVERERLMSFVLVDPILPSSPTNRVADDPAAVELGHKLFFETRFSGKLEVGDDGQNGGLGAPGEEEKISCRACHDLKNGAADTRSRGPTSLGFKWTPRNTPTVYNMAWLTFNHLDGRKHTIWGGNTAPPEGALHSSRLKVAHRLYELYRADYEALFGPMPDLSNTARFPSEGKPGQPAWDEMSDEDKTAINEVYANFGKALEAYMRRLVDHTSPFDLYMNGDTAALEPAAIRGMKLFVGRAACDECHSGPTLTNNQFRNIGVPQLGEYVKPVDLGRIEGIAKVIKDPFTAVGAFSDDKEVLREEIESLEPVPLEGLPTGCEELEYCGAFKIPTLRSVALTAPYMHTGAFDTLRDVLDFYSHGKGAERFVGRRNTAISPLYLSEQEIDDLVAFLYSLTGKTLPEELYSAPELPPSSTSTTSGA